MAKKRLTVVYDDRGNGNEMIEETLDRVLKEFGYQPYTSGYSAVSPQRKLVYETDDEPN